MDRDVDAVVAHGLLNTLGVIAASAQTIRTYGGRLTGDDRELILSGLVSRVELFNEGLRLLLRDCSDQFADAATTLTLLARTLRALPPDDVADVLVAIVERSDVLSNGLQALVRGLPPEVRALLDSLSG